MHTKYVDSLTKKVDLLMLRLLRPASVVILMHLTLVRADSYQFPTLAELEIAVDAWCADETDAAATYGDITTWDTSLVTSMRDLFMSRTSCTGDVSQWNTSLVTDMHSLFFKAYSFNADLSQWDTRKVTDMSATFKSARAFNQDISSWNTSEVATMYDTFLGAWAFNSDISQWDTSKVTGMEGMFEEAYAFNQDISNWEISSVTTVKDMFYDARAFDQVLCWDVVGKNRLGMFDGSSGSIGSTSVCLPGDDDDSSNNDDGSGSGGSESQSSVDVGHVLAGSIGAVVAVCIILGGGFAGTAYKKCLAEGNCDVPEPLQLRSGKSQMIEREVELSSRSAI